MQKQPPENFCKKAVFKNFEIFTAKHLCWRLFLIHNIVKFLIEPILKNICERLLLTMFMTNVNTKWKQDFLTSVSEINENVYLFAFISSLVSVTVCIYIQYFFDVEDVVRNKYLC